jgi:hypothetical protein
MLDTGYSFHLLLNRQCACRLEKIPALRIPFVPHFNCQSSIANHQSLQPQIPFGVILGQPFYLFSYTDLWSLGVCFYIGKDPTEHSLIKFKEGEDFNRRNTLSILRIEI